MADIDDVAELILIRLDAKDLIRCKCVSKSWYSLITSPGFINLHLTRSYNKDRYNSEYGHRRIILSHEIHNLYVNSENHHQLVGSSNGLVCISTFIISKVLVGNPLTREVRHLKLPSWIGIPLCWGFGYDSSRDDYKLILGSWKGMNFKVFSLKSNAWKVIGKVNYAFIHKDGVLSNGALHWIIKDQNHKTLIISYDLSKDEFTEIPQPDDARYVATPSSYMGIIKDCLCIYQKPHINYPEAQNSIWLMKEYNVKQSWELLPHDREMGYIIVHHLQSPEDYILPESVFYHESWFSKFDLRVHINDPIFVHSLVSPHVNGRQKRAVNNKQSIKEAQEQMQEFEAVKMTNSSCWGMNLSPNSLSIL